jgi:hypothetical protein
MGNERPQYPSGCAGDLRLNPEYLALIALPARDTELRTYPTSVGLSPLGHHVDCCARLPDRPFALSSGEGEGSHPRDRRKSSPDSHDDPDS